MTGGGGTRLPVLALLFLAHVLQPSQSFAPHVLIQRHGHQSRFTHASSCHDGGYEETAQQRRGFLTQTLSAFTLVVLGSGAGTANAVPPIAVIAEELGYFPVTNSKDETVYVPRRVKRASSGQAVELARKLRDTGATVYTAYWCPHCARQKELLGLEAWQMIRNVECAPRGYNAQSAMCLAQNVDGYPTWVLGDGQRISGERDLVDLAKAVGMSKFDASLEQNLPPPLGSTVCK